MSVRHVTMSGVARLGVGIELVGRRAEMGALGAALERAAEGKPTGILLAGDAGVGKSRLVTETVERAAAAGYAVLTGRCLDSSASLPYLPFTEVVGQLVASSPEQLTEHPELSRLLPGHLSVEAVDRELGQLRVFDAMLSALDSLTAKSPALLVFEDLHWADRSSRDLLVFLLSRLTAQRLVVLATYRTDDLHRRHPLRPVLSELVRLPAVERLELAPLDAGDTLDLVRRLADGSLSEALLRRAAERSEGNAFFAEELVSASSDGLPHGLAEVLMARIEGLPPATQLVLRLAAVAGRRVEHGLLAAVSELSDDELEQALRDAVTHHVLVADTGGGDAYVFRHALLREAIYTELLPGERSRLHARYAKLLAEQGEEAGAAAELAHHAVAAHDLPLALAASVRAAREADRRAAPAEVLLHTERALELWDAVPDADRVSGMTEIRLTTWAAWMASASGDPDRGIALGRRALDLAERGDDPALTATLSRRYAMRLLELTGRDQEALDSSCRAIELHLDLPATAETAWAQVVHARVLCRLDLWSEARTSADTAMSIIDGLDPDDADVVGARADALITLGICDERAGDPQHARQRWHDAQPLARRARNLGVELRAQFYIGMSLLDEGRLAESSAAFATGERRAAETGITWSGYGLDLRVSHVVTQFMRGDWNAAETAAEIAGESVSATVASRLAAAGLLTAVGRGKLEFAGRRATELRDSHPADDQVVLLLGQAGAEAALWRGDGPKAVQRVDDALARLDELFPHQLGGIMLSALGVAAHAEIATKEPARREQELAAAQALVARAEETAEKGAPRACRLGPEGIAWLHRARAELTRFTGQDPAAWTTVIEAFAYESPESEAGGYRQAYARLRRAEALLAGGAAHGPDHGAVVDDLRAAREVAECLGAGPLATAVAAMAVRAGVRLDDEAAVPAPEVLTPRERSVLALVADGRTNRQVGAELYISEKTVSVHLSRVMAKLGAGSRTEAVTIAYARGLLDPPARLA
jgi:DNA-binding CsgD family transcriptional regulator/tetratricopeptide (TPR) repeat protein